MQDNWKVNLIQHCRREKDPAQILRWGRLWSWGSRHMRLLRGTAALSIPCRHENTLHIEQRKSVVPLMGM